jgi:hypothetical protein
MIEPVEQSDQRDRADMLRLAAGQDSVLNDLVERHGPKLFGYLMRVGIYRRLCSNGLVVSEDNFEAIRFRHAGLKADEVVQASYRILETAYLGITSWPKPTIFTPDGPK